MAAAANGQEVVVMVLNGRHNERCWVRRGEMVLSVCWEGLLGV